MLSAVRGGARAARGESRRVSSAAGRAANKRAACVRRAAPRAEERLNIVFSGFECAPYSKKGGLGDVMESLPKALVKRGHRVMTVSPMYYDIEFLNEPCGQVHLEVCGTGVDVHYYHYHEDGVDRVFVDHPSFREAGAGVYTGSTMDVAWRGALLSQASIEAVWHVPCGGYPYGTDSLVYVANDWHTALLPVYLRAFYHDHGILGFARAVLTVHNISHQGRLTPDDVWRFGLPDHHTGAFYLDDPLKGACTNLLKAGMEYATKVIAVSPSYAWEISTDEGGWGLAPTVRNDPAKYSGIINGIDFDTWSPEHDKYLTTDGYQTYGTNMEGLWTGKQACKAALQRELGLSERHETCVIGFIGRLDEQKGIDLVLDSEDFLMGQDIQMIFLGSGRGDLADRLYDMECRNHDKVRAWIGYSNPMAHRITAGCDILIMPSRYEPCGLNQMYAMHYGTVPVVHAVGGLRDSVQHYNPYEGDGCGWTFDRAEVDKFKWTLGEALHTFFNHREEFMHVALRGIHKDLGWEHAAREYEGKLIEAKYSH